MNSDLNIYLEALTKVKRGSTEHYGLAPHKPILLITLMELIEKGHVWHNQIPINSILAATFKQNWDLLVTTGHQADITQPLFYLQNDKARGSTFWRLVTSNNVPLKSHIASINSLTNMVAYAEFSEELFDLFTNPVSRKKIKERLLDCYFPLTKQAMRVQEKKQYELGKLEQYILQEPEAQYKTVQSPEMEFEIFVRNGNFKKFIPMVYASKCCFTGMQTRSIFKHTLVDACHIIPFSTTQDDSIGNGLALTPTMHRAFDAGLITIDQNYRIIVSNAVIEDKNHHYSLSKLAKKRIFLPSDKRFYPSQEKLEWHRKIRFKN